MKIHDIIKTDIIFFDLETTGIEITLDKIVELCAIKFTTNGEEIKLHKYFNPIIPVKKEAFEKHGLSNEYLLQFPTFEKSVEEVYNFFQGCDIGGYNCIKFDMAMLYEEFARCGKKYNFTKINMVDSFMLKNKFEPNTLEAVYERMFNEKIENAHSAFDDITATIRVFENQIDIYDLKDKSISDISKIVRHTNHNETILDLSGFFKKVGSDVIFIKGKHRDCNVKEHLDYLDWMAYKSNFERNTKDVAMMLYNKYNK